MSRRPTLDPSTPAPPGTWTPARKLVARALAPVEAFLAIETASGLVLLAVATIALAWANSPWAALYFELWHTPIGLSIGSFSFTRDLHFWINDGLMTIFFFVVGLEIRREIHGGELSELRRAALPLLAALGGMIAPALIYTAFNHGRGSAAGWGIPMATDIAFAVGVIALLGKRVAPALRILLLALAVIDDVGAILVIALFYSGELAAHGLGLVAVGVAIIFALQKIGARPPWAYIPAGVVIWAGMYQSGIHPTLAGVIVGLMTPARAWLGGEGFARTAAEHVRSIESGAKDAHELLLHLDDIDAARREAVSPVERLQHALHSLVAFVIMPLFALANAGVPLGDAALEGDGLMVFLGVSIGLLVGKPLGVVALSFVGARVGIAAIPRAVRWRDVSVVGLAAGIGFTMALFVAQLAFPKGALLETAKLAILVGSAASGVLAYAVGRVILREPTEGARTTAEAEASTEA